MLTRRLLLCRRSSKAFSSPRRVSARVPMRAALAFKMLPLVELAPQNKVRRKLQAGRCLHWTDSSTARHATATKAARPRRFNQHTRTLRAPRTGHMWLAMADGAVLTAQPWR